jgi:hypothetical protein
LEEHLKILSAYSSYLVLPELYQVNPPVLLNAITPLTVARRVPGVNAKVTTLLRPKAPTTVLEVEMEATLIPPASKVKGIAPSV